ncbi:PREDICTED: F-box/kelch-repeat protein At3g06240-like [Fragaria vesca subsp. vesca]|uniref:F-box/kelch-repeat protein At3g06240-like n=1 Tax=Fragaria vesca subsp. vesca TaxID=101020 RepID=UPI0002C351E8|nr:PREDICTED: F-box/kelch-repeat protein At3g06240-like [Fragaria vesca subsp. vesca]
MQPQSLLSHPDENPNPPLLLSITTNNLESLELDRISLGNRADAHILASPAALPGRDVVLLGSCNDYRAIPPPPLPASEFGYAADPPFRHFGGFGYVSATQDYKLVLSAYVGIVPAAEGHPEDYDTVDVQVFSLNNETWGEEITSPCFAAVEGQGVLVNQKLHWVLDYYNIDDDGEEHIIAFDLETETFQSMRLPFPSAEPTNDIDNFGVAISRHEGNLCVWYYNKRAASVDYWIMEIYGENGSWRRFIFNISTQPPISFLKPLMVTESAIVLVRCSTTGVLELVRIRVNKEMRSVRCT